MVDYTFSATGTQTVSSFNVDTDVLTFSSSVGSAADISVTEVGGSTVFRHASGGTTTLTGITMDKLSTSNINFTNGSRLYAGDGTTATLLDSLAQAAATFVLSTAADQVQGLGGNDTITVNDATGNDKIYGNAGDDSITAGAASNGNHTIFAGAGADVVTIAGGGASTVAGDNGNDSVSISGAGANHVNGNAGDDTITWTGTGANNVRGGQGTDTITVGAVATGSNTVNGDNGTDTITVNATASGNNTINGGAGNDTITVNGNGLNVVNGNADADNITLAGTGASSIRGGQGGDTITVANTATGAHIIWGDAGDDTVASTFAGAAVLSTVFGGAGNDTLRFNYGGAAAHRQIIGDFGTGTDIVQVTLSGGATAAGLTVTGLGSSPTIANAANEAISFSGYTGNFNSTNFVLSDSTILATNSGTTAATLTGGAGADQLIAGNGGDVLTGSTGADKMIGGSGIDIFLISLAADHAANETINGGAGVDIVRFNTAVAAATLTLDDDVNVERAELATGNAAAGDTTGVVASNINAAATTVWGGTQTGIYLHGNNGANVLTASTTGNDTLVGGGGADTLALGAAGNGNDVVAWLSTSDVSAGDTVTNFNFTNDVIGFSTTLTGLTAGALAAANYGEANITSTAGADNGLVTTAVNGLANVATLKVLVLVDNDGGAQAFTAADIDLGLKDSTATGAGFVVALLDDAAGTATTVYYDPNFDNNGDLVTIAATFTTAGTNLTLANAETTDFVII